MKALGADLQLEEPVDLQPCSGSVWMLLQEPVLVVLWAPQVHQQGPQLELLWYQEEQWDRFIHFCKALVNLKQDISCSETRWTEAETLKAGPGSVFMAEVFQVSYRLRKRD